MIMTIIKKTQKRTVGFQAASINKNTKQKWHEVPTKAARKMCNLNRHLEGLTLAGLGRPRSWRGLTRTTEVPGFDALNFLVAKRGAKQLGLLRFFWANVGLLFFLLFETPKVPLGYLRGNFGGPTGRSISYSIQFPIVAILLSAISKEGAMWFVQTFFVLVATLPGFLFPWVIESLKEWKYFLRAYCEPNLNESWVLFPFLNDMLFFGILILVSYLDNLGYLIFGLVLGLSLKPWVLCFSHPPKKSRPLLLRCSWGLPLDFIHGDHGLVLSWVWPFRWFVTALCFIYVFGLLK